MKLLPVTPLLLLLSLFSLADSYLYPASRFAGTRTTALGALPLPGGGNTDKDIENIFKQNEEWVQENLRKDKDYFNKLGSGHTPEYLWIGCSDARVSPNVLMGEDAGSVFTVRNVANMVIGTDFNLMSALQYAVGVLKIPHIIVCGHYDCGGVRASIENKDHVPPLENWLRNIRDVYRLHRKELDAIKDPESRHRRLVELNVVEQCINLFKTGAIQRRRVETFQDSESPFTTPRIHACVFDPKDGRLRRLNVDFREYINELHDIYDLYEPDRVENSENLPDYISKQVAFNIDEECVLVPPNAPTPVAGGLETECASPPVTMLDEKEEIKEINGKSKSKNILKRAWKKVTN